MNENQIIAKLLTQYLEKHPTERFGQALFNCGINENLTPHETHKQRDIYNDTDTQILERMAKELSKIT